MSQVSVRTYLPQRPPFVMIDAIESADARSARSIFTIREDHLLVEDGFFTEPGLIENMAQTAAAGTGYLAAQESKTPPVGFIGALKGFILHELPAVGETIQTEITFAHAVMNAQIVQAVVRCGEREIAGCELKIFLQQESGS